MTLAPVSADRRRVLDTAHVPVLVDPTRNIELRVRSDIAVEYLAIISDIAYDPRHPISAQPETGPKILLKAHEPANVRLLRPQGIIDGL